MSDDRDRIIEAYEKTIAHLKEIIRNAKDVSPVIKPSFSRVKRMAQMACLQLSRENSSYVLSMGDKCKRTFKKLRDIWEFLSQEEWALSDLFPQLDPEKAAKPKGKPCKFCGVSILWLPNTWGKWLPHNIEGGDRHRCDRNNENVVFTNSRASPIAEMPFS